MCTTSFAATGAMKGNFENVYFRRGEKSGGAQNITENREKKANSDYHLMT